MAFGRRRTRHGADVYFMDRTARERARSEHISAMPFVCLPVDDLPGPGSLRGVIERNAIALLSCYRGTPLDLPSPGWLGLQSDRERVMRSVFDPET